MSKNKKIILNYPNYQNIITQYLNLEEFKGKANDTMRSKRVTITAFCNYLGYNGLDSIELCQQKHVSDFMENISPLSTSTKSGKAFILRHFFNYLYSINLISYSGKELFPVIVTNVIVFSRFILKTKYKNLFQLLIIEQHQAKEISLSFCWQLNWEYNLVISAD